MGTIRKEWTSIRTGKQTQTIYVNEAIYQLVKKQLSPNQVISDTSSNKMQQNNITPLVPSPVEQTAQTPILEQSAETHAAEQPIQTSVLKQTTEIPVVEQTTGKSNEIKNPLIDSKQLEIEEKIKELNSSFIRFEEQRYLQTICQKTAEITENSRIIDFFSKIKNIHLKLQAFVDTCINLSAKGEFDQVIELANTIDDRPSQKRILSDIYGKLKEKEKFDQAINIINKSKAEDYHKNTCLVNICKELVAKNEFVQALDLANKMTNPKVTTIIFYEYKNDETQEMIPRDTALRAICQAYENIEKVDESLQLVKEITDKKDQISILQRIAKKFASNGNILKAKEVAIEIMNLNINDDNSFYVSQICASLIKMKKLEEAAELLELLKDKNTFHYGSTLTDVIKELLSIGKDDEAIELANKMPDKEEFGK